MYIVLSGWIIVAIHFFVTVVAPEGLLIAFNWSSILILASTRLCIEILMVKLLGRTVVWNTETATFNVCFLVACCSFRVNCFSLIFVDEGLFLLSWRAAADAPGEPNSPTYILVRCLPVMLTYIILLNSDLCSGVWLKF